MRNEYGLTPQQERFAQEVACGESQSEAYRRAYPQSRNWTTETVYAKASALAANGKVRARVSGIARGVASVAVLQAVDVLNQIRHACLSDVGKLVGPDGRVLLPHELDDSTRMAVASFKADEFGKVEYKFWDKMAALEKACKILGLYEKDNQQKTDPLRDLLASLSGNVVGVANEHGERVAV